jgi:hypothetical protein
MSYVPIPAFTAASVARRQQALHDVLREKEEEEMALYTQEDLNEDWEFKIVRAGTAAFRKSEVLEELLEEEARAGWIMLEKLDDSRVRFKRPRSARAKDAYLPEGVDPYRTQYGSASNQHTAMTFVIAGMLLLSALAGLFVFIYATR